MADDGVLACVAGVDCSGFVSQVWQLPQRQTTSSISAAADLAVAPGGETILFLEPGEKAVSVIWIDA